MSIFRYQSPALATWSPFDRFGTLRSELDRLFDFSALTRDPRSAGSGTATAAANADASTWAPALDVHDGKDAYVVVAELPGLKKEEINLSLHDGVLTLSGERKNERETKEGETYRSERYFGKFQRSITLPAAVNSAKVTAAYKDGVLTIELPKAEEAKPKQIEVSVS